MVGAGRNTAGRQVRSGIRHGSILRVAAKGAVIGAEIGEAARTATANVLSFCREDKEDIVDVRGPTLHLLGMRYFALYLCIRQSSRRIGGRIHPGTSSNGIAGVGTAAI